MAEANFSIRVEKVPSYDAYAWVIMELRDGMEPVEVAASLQTYPKPSDAIRAAERVLGVLAPLRL